MTRMPRVSVLYNEPASRGSGAPDASETGVLGQVAAIAKILEGASYEVRAAAIHTPEQLAQILKNESPDIVFNCCEALNGRAELEASVAGLFELFGIPYTGSPPLALAQALNKDKAKALLRAHSVPTPNAAVMNSAADLSPAASLSWPLIVKPLSQDASLGIHHNAVVHDQANLEERVRAIIEEFGPALVEEYIEGREFMVPLIAETSGKWKALPIAEVSFENLPSNHPRVFTYEAKWIVDSPMYQATPLRWPSLDAGLTERLQTTARSAAVALGIRDYGRVDFRMNSNGEIFVIEVNPNPDLNQDSGFFPPQAESEFSQQVVVLEVLKRALERGRRSRS